MLLLIDNYDSFTYNLVQYFQILGQEVLVRTHDQISVEEIKQLNPNYLVISPGPKAPDDAGVSLAAIKELHQKIPILGVCLGHQCLAQVFGGKVISAPQIIHGGTSPILHHYQGLFRGLPNYFNATRYHSLAVEIDSLPTCLAIDAWADDTIMAISHRQYPLFGLQFHPEAILSEHGLSLLENFLHYESQSTL
ncbi:aminodeoxychorismate/anthranilate synthase component II [Legionella sp. km772]|uniref:anthranilate synthase component II n=1 Tax=Legionella sp. km772 TaxID=2498111 RepID=UPI000F8EACF9|nr:aminodeoxychorismate/anthranilate synthase component II [Legionella sp. km772]RUR12074.1 aminodeoxychorismate/anthranilate synthase component II [Legionella sp. km772]